MKKVLIVILALAAVGLTACSTAPVADETVSTPVVEETYEVPVPAEYEAETDTAL